jgi:serine/threonine-protein kinase
MPSQDDVEFAKAVIRQGFADQGQVSAALKAQKKDRATPALREVMVALGMITAQMADQVVRDSQVTASKFPKIPGYEITKPLGRGGMGMVFLATQTSLDRQVAIKTLFAHHARSQDFIARFQREARAAAAVNHENIVGGIDVGEVNGVHYFVMEFVEGRTCYDILQQEGLFPERNALKVIYQVARALGAAHSAGLVHRDIKPDNIMITNDGGMAKLCDLGLAKNPLVDPELTASGMTHGTPQYMSPEQARGDRHLDVRSDIYSLGVTLYRLITGKYPIEGEAPAKTLMKQISDPFASPKLFRPELSDGVCHLISRMMAKLPKDRYQTPDELKADIKKVLNNRPASEMSAETGPKVMMRTPEELAAAGMDLRRLRSGDTAQHSEPPWDSSQEDASVREIDRERPSTEDPSPDDGASPDGYDADDRGAAVAGFRRVLEIN